jgi:Nuclease A inhibitor-like protein
MEEKKKKEIPDFKTNLTNACRGLTFISETDAEIDPVFGGQTDSSSNAAMLAAVGAPDKKPIEEADPDRFFSRLTTHEEWFDAREKINANGFAKLESILRTELRDLKILRLGKIMIDIYMIGIDTDGNVAGAKTKAIET